MANDILHLLKTRKFLPLFITQFFGAFNDNFLRTALVTLVTYKLTEISTEEKELIVTSAVGLFMLPFFIFSGTAGQIADKYDKSKLIRIIKFAEIIIMLLAAGSLTLKNPQYYLMFVLFLMGTHSAFFGPIKYSILPDHLEQKELLAGNGLVEAGTFLAILLGIITAGLIIGHTSGSSQAVLILIAVASAGFASSLYIPPTTPANKDIKIEINFLRKTSKIMKYTNSNRALFRIIMGISWFWLVGAVFIEQIPNLANNILRADHSVSTFMFALFSVGMGIGSILCHKLLKGEISAKYVPVAALLMVPGILVFSFISGPIPASEAELANIKDFLSSPKGWLVSVALLTASMIGGVYIVPLYALMQSRSDPAQRSQVVAANNIMNALFMVISSIISAILLSLINLPIQLLFLILAIAHTFIAFYICTILPETVLKSALRKILGFLYKVELRGAENYEKAGDKVLIIANHPSFLDPLLLAAFLPGNPIFAVNTHMARRWFMRIALSFVRYYPVDPTNPMATKALINEVKNGQKIVIFPEGRITVTGSLMKVYEGPGVIADKSGAMLLPIRIDGAQYTPFSRIKGKVRMKYFPKITLTILEPKKFEITESSGKERRKIIAEKLYDIMSMMMFESSDYRKTLFESLLDARSTHGGHHPIVEDIERNTLNYNKFITGCFLLGNKLAARTHNGEYIGILLPNMVRTIILFFAAQAYGRIPAMLNYSTGARNIVLSCKISGAKKVITSRTFIENAKLFDMANDLIESGISIIYLEDITKNIKTTDKISARIKSFFARPIYKLTSKKSSPDRPCVILFTSGSEGSPKGVALSHTNIQANRYQLSSRVDFGPTDIVFSALPVFHSFGLNGGTLLPILSGIKTFFYPSPLHYRIVPELIYDTNATIMFGTDTFLSGYAKSAHAYDFYSLRYVFAGAEKLKDETRRIWSEKFGVRIFEGYGATETAPVLSTNTAMHNKRGTVGRFLPGINYRLEEVPGVSDGGRLFVSGANIMLGYMLTDRPGVIIPPENGVYDTGDIVAIDDEGYITIKGRAKRFAKIGGEMVSLAAVENYISDIWPDYHHAVINLPDESKGEILILVTDYKDALRSAIISYVHQHQISEISVPRKIIIIDKMPLLGTGKTDYVKVKEIAENS